MLETTDFYSLISLSYTSVKGLNLFNNLKIFKQEFISKKALPEVISRFYSAFESRYIGSSKSVYNPIVIIVSIYIL